MQIEHYTEYIKKNPTWEFAGIYADDGISGTNTKKREEFNRLIDDCMAGCIEMVVIKSISRFARNTLDCLNYIRKLKEKNIPVYFEKEGIKTAAGSMHYRALYSADTAGIFTGGRIGMFMGERNNSDPVAELDEKIAGFLEVLYRAFGEDY